MLRYSKSMCEIRNVACGILGLLAVQTETHVFPKDARRHLACLTHLNYWLCWTQ